MMRFINVFSLSALLCLGGVTAAVAEDMPDLDALAAGSEEGATRCLAQNMVRNTTLLNDQYILFEAGPRAWLNKLSSPCASINRHQSLVFDRTGAQLCRGDTVKGVERGGINSGRCTIGDFYAIDQEYADGLRAAAREGQL